MSNAKIPKQADNKVGEYTLQEKFPGYNARLDRTTVGGSYLVAPSQNVLIGTSGRVGTVRGYTLDGPGSPVIDSGIRSNYDFENINGDVRNTRAGFLSSAGNDGKYQFRYVDPITLAVTWIDLVTGLSNVVLSFAEFWDDTNLIKDLLWVNGDNTITSWTGAVTTYASGTPVQPGVIAPGGLASAPTAGGSGWNIGDKFTITGGTGGTGIVSNTSSGVVTAVTLVNPGSGYSTGAGQATTAIAPSAGTGLTVDITTIESSASLTKQGTKTFAEEGFLQTGSITIGGTSYAYTDGYNTTTLTGFTSDMSTFTVGQELHETPVVTDIASMTGIDPTFAPTVIGCGRLNQVYLGTTNSNLLYISQVNSFTNYSFTTPTRIAGEGALIPLAAPPIAFVPLENRNDQNTYDLYISQGVNNWSVVRTSLVGLDPTSTNSYEILENIQMKTSYNAGAISERLVSKMKNHIIYIDNNNVAEFMGYISYQNVPETVDFSYPIIKDMNVYDFTGGQIFYYNNYIFVSVPKSGIIRIFNMTDQTKETTSSIRGIEDVDPTQPWFWEVPITYPIAGFYCVDGKIYGHGYTNSESYLLFNGGTFNGQSINAIAAFGYDDLGDRTQAKGSNQIWVDGYISQNTVLNVTINEDLDAFLQSQTVQINGSDSSIVGFGTSDHSLGAVDIGSNPHGEDLAPPYPDEDTSINTPDYQLPPYFHVVKTYVQNWYHLEQVVFQTNGADLAWEIISFGTNKKFTNEGNNSITQ